MVSCRVTVKGRALEQHLHGRARPGVVRHRGVDLDELVLNDDGRHSFTEGCGSSLGKAFGASSRNAHIDFEAVIA